MTPTVTAERPTRPTPLSVRIEGIPQSLKNEHRWVGWRYVWRDGKDGKDGKPGKWTKPPYVATAPATLAASTDPTTWRTYPEALAAYEDGKFDGIGFVLGDGYVGYDADDIIATDNVGILNTYAEFSPSGHGVHAIAKGTKPGTSCRVGNHELYDVGRYLTVTGHHIPDTPTEVEERTAEIAVLYSRLFPPDKDTPAAPAVTTTSSVPDDELITLAKASKTGAKFAALWSGDITGYTSHSEADLALCAILAFWTNRNAEQMDRMFRCSGLMRPKWDERRGSTTIAADLIAKAIASTTHGYTGKKESPDIVLRKASSVADEKLDKRFGGRLVRGAFVVLAGPGEGGKGMTMVSLATSFTTGDPFPNEIIRRSPGNVMICTTEDSMGRVKSRLRAAGADLERVFFVEGPEVTRGGLIMPSPMMLDDDAGSLVRHAKQIGAEALFLETVVEHFGDRKGSSSRRSTNNEADVRSALSPFRQVCASAGLFGLGAIHPRKSVEGSVDDSISGSAAFRNVTRAAHHIYRDPEDEEDNPVRLFFTSKSNYSSRRPKTLRFRIESWDEERGIPCGCHETDCGHEGRVVWEQDLIDQRTADEIWNQIAQKNKPRRDLNVQEAEEFLSGLMQGNEIKLVPEKIFKMASDAGITKAAVRRAKETLKLVSKKDGYPAAVIGWEKAMKF